MTLELNILEYHVTSIFDNIKNKMKKEKAGIGIEQLVKDKRIFTVCFSKKVGLVKFVFNLKKHWFFVTREIFWWIVVI